jgi:restriction system protein
MVPHKIAWARSYLREAGLLKSEGGGVWVLTDAGRDMIGNGDAAIRQAVKDAMKAYNAKRKGKKAGAKAAKAAAIEDDESETNALWSDMLLTKVQGIHPAAFERLCQLLLRKAGFTQGR